MHNTDAFVNWFRESSPYIHAHRNRTFVIYFGGEAMLDENLHNLIHDFALLNSLGIRLVLVHGIRPQIDQRLKAQNKQSQFHQQLRITNNSALQCVKESAGLVRVEIESLLSLGLANSPMSGARVRVISGNFVTAQPLGVLEGIDYQHTGKVRRIDSAAIHQQLDLGHVVLVSPIGYTPSGELFNLSAEQLATEIAVALQAEKLILMTEQSCISTQTGQLIAQMTSAETRHLIEHETQLAASAQCALKSAIYGCQAGVNRVHILNRKVDGALLIELFSRDGIGTLISSTEFEIIRPARISDIPGILELITPLIQQGYLIARSVEHLEINIKDYIVIDRDGLIIGCTALHKIGQQQAGLIACLAVHPEYQKAARGNQLLEQLYSKAKQQSLNKLFALSTQTMHWFKERNFQDSDFSALPAALQKSYNHMRNAKVLVHHL
ncbi:amino-acid N-acetyltransferase [Bathymodiolus japonicus methanotrophic gill symbiont]|uniref:amino-acid N-acetyltransferase n=1 Tax=Bathymodiolus japonicus methanotrophic gill symbiont TaxID=113269 RepID=UPI001B54FE87|nr:amino-acid N-acetyltransferase [Bathymodiolus japonicus methanotrophic gill symbiont]GFO71146.1 amino-acid N-acetyltransferase [Bathymodiolus japonicus methanotrophic gill symbiont]